MDLQQTLDEAQRLFTTAVDDANAALSRDETKEAKRVLANGQRELRDLKREVANEEREMRAEFQAARLKVDKTGQAFGAFAGSKARGAMARGRAMDKRNLASQKASNADLYRRLKATLDDYISKLDGMKFKVDSTVGSEKAPGATAQPKPVASAGPPPPPPPTPAMWAADPFGRHEHRYWDGTRWTEHVADAGVQGIDPPG